MIDQSVFEAYANERKKAMAQEEAKKNNGGYGKTFEEVHYTTCEADVPTIVRVVGGPIDKNLDPTDARTVTVSMIMGDDGHKFKVCRNASDKSYILNRIINDVTKAKWDKDGNKSYPVQEEHPEVYNIIMKNGVPSTDPKYKYEKGWKGSEVIMMNVINRADMDWHRANKHTALLAKSVSDKGFADEGLSAFSTRKKFDKLIATYQSWEQFDIGIVRHADKDNPYDIYNVSKNPEFIEEYGDKYVNLVSTRGLTEEEDNWERYDLEKKCRPTSVTRLYNKLKATIAKIDLALGTHYLNEMEEISKREQEEWDKEKAEREAKGAEAPKVEEKVSKVEEHFYDDDPILPSEPVAKPVARRASAPSANEEWKKFPYVDAIPSHLRAKCLKVIKTDEGFTGEWSDDIDTATCSCGCESPLECTTCPNCGASFEE